MRDTKSYGNKKYWYKGNLHTHTTESDGTKTPEEMIQGYKENGYQVLCITDHDYYSDYSSKYNTEDFILLPGIEASAILMNREGKEKQKVHHMLGILGTKQMQEKAEKTPFKHGEKLQVPIYYDSWNGAEVAGELAQEIYGRGCMVVYNHPIWSRVKVEEFKHTPYIMAMEVYNHGVEIEFGQGDASCYWDMCLQEGSHMNAIATDDSHCFPNYEDRYGGYIMINANELNHESIMQSIIEGNYYSTCGPEIYKFKIEGNQVQVKCSPVEKINFIVGNDIVSNPTMFTPNKEKGETLLTEASYCLTGNESYVRVECTDKFGKKACTNVMRIN